MKIIIGLAFVVLVVPLGAVYAEVPIVLDLTVSDSTNITEYINRFYTSAVAIAGITAVIMIVIGAIYYVVSGGSQDKQREGKDIITSAIWGVVLLLGAYTILNTVNPELVTLSPPGGDKPSQYSCTVLRETTPDIRECDVGERPIEDPSDPTAVPRCCIPGLGYVPSTELPAGNCPLSVTENCGVVLVTEKKTIPLVFRCIDTKTWWCDKWFNKSIKEGGAYAMWAYYPKDGDAGVVAELQSRGGFNIPKTEAKGSACIIYAYKENAGDSWTSITIPPELKLCLGFAK